MKKIILLFVFCSATILAAAQSYNYRPFAIGFGASSTLGYTNVAKQNYNYAFDVNGTYNYSPYLPVAAELQFGKLSGGGVTVDKYGRQYSNSYKALVLHGDLQAGELIDYYGSDILRAIKGFYIGTGFGFINNNNTVQRTNLILANGPLTYVFPGKDKSTDFMVPLRFGYEFKIYNDIDEPFMRLYIGYVHNIVIGEGLDGYDDPDKHFKNNAFDQYRQITIGIKYDIGNVTSYVKSIR